MIEKLREEGADFILHADLFGDRRRIEKAGGKQIATYTNTMGVLLSADYRLPADKARELIAAQQVHPSMVLIPAKKNSRSA